MRETLGRRVAVLPYFINTGLLVRRIAGQALGLRSFYASVALLPPPALAEAAAPRVPLEVPTIREAETAAQLAMGLLAWKGLRGCQRRRERPLP